MEALEVRHRKVVQTRLTEQEYQFLADYAARGEQSLQDALREVVQRLMREKDTVDPNDLAFTLPPGGKATGRKRNVSGRVDEIVYGRKWRK